jgi:hypothetical protein
MMNAAQAAWVPVFQIFRLSCSRGTTQGPELLSGTSQGFEAPSHPDFNSTKKLAGFTRLNGGALSSRL